MRQNLEPRGLFALCSRFGLLTLVLSLLALSACGDDGSGSYGAVSLGKLRVSPTVLTFDSNEIDVESVQFLTLENVGEGQLTIAKMELDTRSAEFSLRQAEFPFSLEPGEIKIVEVVYTPSDCNSDRGNIVISSNDRDAPSLPIPLQPQELTGQVRVHPNPIDFGRVPSGMTRTQTVTITNAGTCALDINDLFLTGSFDFEFTEAAEDGLDVEFTSFEPTLPIALETSESATFQITYHPENDGFDEATMIVRSDDARNRNVDVPVVANGDQACIVVSEEDGIDYGQRFIGEEHPKTITITNCSQHEDLLLSRLDMIEHDELDGFDRYVLTDVPDLTEPLVIMPQESTSVVLTYSPILYTPDNHEDCDDAEGCEIADGAMMIFESNDEVKSPLYVEVRGVGTNNHCPVAVARARVQGTDFWDTQLDTIPLATLEFDGRNSSDPEGGIATYQWEVASRPDGSTAGFSPNANVPNPTFFLDLAGQFIFRLRVFDDSGVESCDPADVMVIVTPNEHVHVQLVWQTPGDPNELDTGAGTGSDVDLHFLHPNGVWDMSPWDCHWKNKVPNWGDSGSRDDDPSLDIDDTDGAGPENINLNNPEGTTAAPIAYKVGIFYFSDHNYGPANTTVRIFLDGRERFALTFPNLENRQFWDVARIEWPTRNIERIHTLFPSGFP